MVGGLGDVPQPDLENLGLGDVFLDDVERAFARIHGFPDATPAVVSGIRKLVLAKFPFTIIYSARVDVIRVLAVAHQKKRPYYWRGRKVGERSGANRQ